LEAGRSVVVNVSRTVIADAGMRFPHVQVVEVTAPDAVLHRRLAARGRGSDGDLESRRKRQVRIETGANIGLATVVNDRSLEEASTAFIEIILDRFEIEAASL
jgi:ribose 1,5-bisphosphokinase